MLMHESHFGSRAWSFDGMHWYYNYTNQVYQYFAETEAGVRISCADGREEPRLLLDRITGQPTVLSTLCKKGGGPIAGTHWTRVLLQRIRDDHAVPPRAAARVHGRVRRSARLLLTPPLRHGRRSGAGSLTLTQ